MSRQKEAIKEMEEAFATIQLEDEEYGGLNYENNAEDLSESDTRWCLVGRFLTESSIDFQAMQHKMASLWRPGRGVYMKQLDTNRYLFQFYHEVDIKRVVDGSPWMFGQFHLVLQKLKHGDNPRTIEINKMDLWVQLHDMSAGFMSQRVSTDIGNYLGTFLEDDPNNFIGVWREFLRIRVSISLDIPIKRRMKLRKSEKDWCWVNFKYEAIPTFCFICGMIGHGERFCEAIFDTPLESIEKPYGAWLRADSRRKSHTMGAKWLRNGGNFQASNSGGKSEADMDKETNVKGADLQQKGGNSGIALLTNQGDKGVNIGKFKGRMDNINQGEICQLNLQNSKPSLEGNNNGPDSLNILDFKRRRTSLDSENNSVKAQSQTSDMKAQYRDNQISKNELLAGAVSQPRLSL